MKNKAKTRKSAIKRFRITPTGKVLRRGHGARHLKSKKTSKRLRSLKSSKRVRGRFAKNIKKMLLV